MAFLLRYVMRHAGLHAVVLGSVVMAVMASVLTQYGLKGLIDIVARGPAAGGTAVWVAFGVLCVLIAGDNFMWRVGCWAAAHVFVRVTGDVRSDLFVHLTGHSPSYFSERMPGTLASRITATSNAIFQTENTTSWNVLPPTLAVIMAISLIGTVNPMMALALGARQPRDGGRHLPHGPRRHADASRFRHPCRQCGWRAGGRDQQHARGPCLRRHLARAWPHHQPHRRGNAAPAAAACSIWKSCAWFMRRWWPSSPPACSPGPW